jgi:DNA-binding Lrp family transcriptional regulator
MLKTSAETRKQDDMKILQELYSNAKESIETIAKRCRFSEQKVRRAIKYMEERHIIWGYTTVTDFRQLDQQRFMLLIKKTNKPLDKKILDKIDSIDLEDIAHRLGLHIVSSYYVHGNYDWIIVFTAKDLPHARKFCDVLSMEFPGATEQFDIQQILYCIREEHIFNPDRTRLQDLME